MRHRRTAAPVFVDRSGRRRRLVVASGAGGAVVVVLALVMLVAGLFGASPLPLPGLPDLVGPPSASRTSGRPDGTTGSTVDASASQPAPGQSASGESGPPRHVPTQTPADRGGGRPTG